MPDSRIPALFVVSGLVDGALPATSVPAPEIARLQLRALQHRHLHAGLDPEGGLIEVLTHDDFVGIGADGAWLTRSPFIAHVSRRPEPTAAPARFDDEAVRLFGPVAVVHGVFAGPSGALRCTDVHLWCGTGWRLVSTQESPLAAGVAHGLFHGAAPAIPAWQGQDPTGDDEAVLTTLNDRYVRAFREADVAWYDAHLAPDFVVVASDGSFRDRAAALAQFALPTFARTMASFPVDCVQVRRHGDIALIHAANCYELKDGRRGESRYTDIWHRQDGRWRCIAAHITSHRAPRQTGP